MIAGDGWARSLVSTTSPQLHVPKACSAPRFGDGNCNCSHIAWKRRMEEFNEKTCAQNLHLTERTLRTQVGDA